MLIHWGKRIREKKLGYVADFCPFCRRMQPITLINIMLVPHIQGIPLGKGELVRVDACCDNCSGSFITDPGRYINIEQIRDSHVLRLQANTFPNFQEYYSQRLQIEEQLIRDPFTLSTETRAELVCEPFYYLVPYAEQIAKGGLIVDKETHISFFSSIGVAATIFIILMATNQLLETWAPTIFLLVGFIGTGFTIYFLLTANKRLIKKKFLRYLTLSLKPLKPSSSEISNALLKYSRFAISKHLKLEHFQEAGIIDNRPSLSP